MANFGLIILTVLLPWAGQVALFAQGEESNGVVVAPTSTPLPKDSLQLVGDRKTVPQWYDFIGNVPHDLGSLALLTVDEKSIPVIVGISALTLGLVATDHDSYVFTSKGYDNSATVASISDVFVSLGDGKSSLVLTGIFGIYGFAASDRRSLRTASQTLEALIATGLVVQALKHISGRESPSVATSSTGTWRPFPSFRTYHRNQSKYHAFPSGHIATTMAAVTVVADNYPEQRWIRPVGYSLVGLVGVSLVANGWHWYSDLPLGIALGYALGKIIAQPRNVEGSTGSDQIGLSIAPALSEHGQGVCVSLHF